MIRTILSAAIAAATLSACASPDSAAVSVIETISLSSLDPAALRPDPPAPDVLAERVRYAVATNYTHLDDVRVTLNECMLRVTSKTEHDARFAADVSAATDTRFDLALFDIDGAALRNTNLGWTVTAPLKPQSAQRQEEVKRLLVHLRALRMHQGIGDTGRPWAEQEEEEAPGYGTGPGWQDVVAWGGARWERAVKGLPHRFGGATASLYQAVYDDVAADPARLTYSNLAIWDNQARLTTPPQPHQNLIAMAMRFPSALEFGPRLSAAAAKELALDLRAHAAAECPAALQEDRQ